MLKYKDFTLKARLYEMDAFEQKLLELGAKYEGEDYQQDYYFKIANGKLKFRKGTIGTLITHYERILVDNMEKTIVYRYEVNPTDLQIQHLYASNELIGETQKNRKLYQLHNMTVHIDELSNGERYIEIEAKDFDDSYTENEAISNCKIE
jgi:predicted adenylyl cyclase CyaB